MARRSHNEAGRRLALKKLGAAGAVAWTAPLVVTSTASAQGTTAAGVLYGCDSASTSTNTVNPVTGVWTLLGATGTTFPARMALMP